jgi:two-component system sensor kinase FixL
VNNSPKHEQAMRQGRALDALLDAAVDAIIIIDGRGTIEQINRAGLALFGYAEDELIGSNIRGLMPEPHRAKHDAYLEAYQRTGKAAIIGQGREETAVKKDGERFPILLTVGEIRQESTRRFVGFVRDLSESRAAEKQVRELENRLLHADRLVTLGELTAGIAHEINQPLTAIAAYADAGRSLTRRESELLREEMQTICERIAEQSRRAAEVVQRLRRLVRGGSAVKGRHEINRIIQDVLLLFEHEVNKTEINIHFTPLSGPSELYVDEIQVQQVLVNLVKNSMDALVAADSPRPLIKIDMHRNDLELHIRVSDNGPGIPQGDEERMFDAFFTSKPNGVGLGLSICRSIAAAHGGSLHYEKPEAGGARFILGLPLETIG